MGRIDDAILALEAGIAFNASRDIVRDEGKEHLILKDKMLELKQKSKKRFSSAYDDGYGQSWKQSIRLKPEHTVPEKCTPQMKERMADAKNLASMGNPKGMYELGMGYFKGRGGLPIDIPEALKWFKKAGDKGYFV